MEYEDFVAQFRARARSRMEEFEKALAKTQKGLAETRAQAETPTRQGRKQQGPPGTGQVPAPVSGSVHVARATPVENHTTQPAQPLKKPVQSGRARTRDRGPVQSILRKA